MATKLLSVTPTPEQRERHRKAAAAASKEKGKIVARARELAANEPWTRVLDDIKAERLRQGLTLDDLAEMTGISKSALSLLESKQNLNPTVGTILRIATCLGRHVEMSFGGERPPAGQSRKPKSKKLNAVERDLIAGLEGCLKNLRNHLTGVAP